MSSSLSLSLSDRFFEGEGRGVRGRQREPHDGDQDDDHDNDQDDDQDDDEDDDGREEQASERERRCESVYLRVVRRRDVRSKNTS